MSIPSTGTQPLVDQTLNHAILMGEVSKLPMTKSLPSGDRLLSFDLRVRSANGPRQSIPISWIGPADKQPTVEEGKNVLVIGEVHRRFYRGGGQLASRVDVRAEVVVTATPGRVRRALSAVIRGLET